MKTKVFIEPGESIEQAEERLEKAIKKKAEKREKRYAKEGYPNQHLDDINQHLVDEHQKVVNRVMADIQALVKSKVKR